MMTEPIEIKGYWWLPSSPDDVVAGILTCTPNDSIKLELIGQLHPQTSAVEEFINREEENVIYGFSSDAKEISLLNCFPSGGSLNFSCKFPIQRYNCQHLIIGAHITSLDTPFFFKTLVDIPYLGLWATPNSIENTMFYNEKKVEKYCISFKTGGNHIDHVDINKFRLSIDGVVNYKGDYFEPKIKQKTLVTLTHTSDFSIKDALSKIFLFEQFLSFAALRPIESKKIVLFTKSKYQELDNGDKHFFPIEYIRVYHGVETNPEQNISKRWSFLFSYDLIKEEFKTIIKKWYSEQSGIAPIRHHLIECVRQKGTFSSVDFLIVIQGIEGFWWRFKDNDYKQEHHLKNSCRTSLYTIIEELVNEFKDIDRLKLNEININEVVDSRHYFSHFVPKEKKPYAKDGWELFELTRKLRKLLICCLLNFVGFTNDQISRIVKDSDSKFFHD